MSRFPVAGEAPTPYSELKPERFERADTLQVQLPGEDAPRRCGEDPDMPPALAPRHYQRPVNLGFARFKRKGG